MQQVILYRRNNCSLCDEAEVLLEILQTSYDFNIEYRDVEKNDEWALKYLFEIPVVELNGKTLVVEQINFDSLTTFLEEHLSK